MVDGGGGVEEVVLGSGLLLALQRCGGCVSFNK
jgi:hypothetical protein